MKLLAAAAAAALLQVALSDALSCTAHADCGEAEWCRETVQQGSCSQADKECRPRVEVGGECAIDGDACEKELCVASAVCDAGRCAAIPNYGAACQTACRRTVRHGWQGYNDGAAWCNLCTCQHGDLQCAPDQCLPRTGETCLEENSTCFDPDGDDRGSECPDGTLCLEPAAGGPTLVCAKFTACEGAGEACEPGFLCDGGLRCVRGKPCALECGQSVAHGYDGPGYGSLSCSTVTCSDGVMDVVARTAHCAVKPCLEANDVCAARAGECPSGTSCSPAATGAPGTKRCLEQCEGDSCKGKQCVTACRKMRDHGWAGPGDGPDSCNNCTCADGVYSCSAEDCGSASCLEAGSVCFGAGVDLSGSCPIGTACQVNPETHDASVKFCRMRACDDDRGCASDHWCKRVMIKTGLDSGLCSDQTVCHPRLPVEKMCDTSFLPCPQDKCAVGASCVRLSMQGEGAHVCVDDKIVCTTTCGKKRPTGWSGKDDGSNHCNTCRCSSKDGWSCTTDKCSERTPECLEEESVCFSAPEHGDGVDVDRAQECPPGTVCKARAGDIAAGGPAEGRSVRLYCLYADGCAHSDDCGAQQWCKAVADPDGTCGVVKACTPVQTIGDTCDREGVACPQFHCAAGLVCLAEAAGAEPKCAEPAPLVMGSGDPFVEKSSRPSIWFFAVPVLLGLVAAFFVVQRYTARRQGGALDGGFHEMTQV